MSLNHGESIFLSGYFCGMLTLIQVYIYLGPKKSKQKTLYFPGPISLACYIDNSVVSYIYHPSVLCCYYCVISVT